MNHKSIAHAPRAKVMPKLLGLRVLAVVLMVSVGRIPPELNICALYSLHVQTVRSEPSYPLTMTLNCGHLSVKDALKVSKS
jgi:hypothetical protein